MLKLIFFITLLSSFTYGAESVDVTLTNALIQKKETFVISPYSLKSVLGLLLPGASGETKIQLQSLLQIDGKNKLQQIKNISSVDTTLKSAQKIWVEQTFPILAAYKQTVVKEFNSEVETADFKQKPNENRLKINLWVEKQTAEKIKDLIPAGMITPSSRLVLVNAIYFLSKWEKPFQHELTKNSKFTRANNSNVKTPFMRQDFENLKYFEDDSMQAISIPYKGSDTVMIIALPKKHDLQNIVKKALELSEKSFTHHQVDVEIPKFKMEFQTDFADLKSQLQIENIFSGQANFSGISESAVKEKLHVSNIIQKAMIAVDENGTEAAAATAAVMMFGSAMPMDPPKNFIANHPFLFMIRHSDENLFVGMYND